MNRMNAQDVLDPILNQQLDTIPQENPLQDEVKVKAEKQQAAQKKGGLSRLKSDRKLLLLSIAGFWLAFICVLTLAVLVSKALQSRPKEILVTTPVSTPTPAIIINNNEIAEPWKSRTETLQKQIQDNQEFNLPEFDQSIGQ